MRDKYTIEKEMQREQGVKKRDTDRHTHTHRDPHIHKQRMKQRECKGGREGERENIALVF